MSQPPLPPLWRMLVNSWRYLWRLSRRSPREAFAVLRAHAPQLVLSPLLVVGYGLARGFGYALGFVRALIEPFRH